MKDEYDEKSGIIRKTNFHTFYKKITIISLLHDQQNNLISQNLLKNLKKSFAITTFIT